MTRYHICIELETARKARGLTYKELAYKVGMTPDNLRGILQGAIEPKLETLIRICNGLGVTIAFRQPFEMG